MKTLIAIPARLKSTRLPEKLLEKLCGKSVLQRTWERASQAQAHRVVILTDSDCIRREAMGFGADVLMTSEDCKNGTERIASVAHQFKEYSWILNVQGDELFVDVRLLNRMIQFLQEEKLDSFDMLVPIFPLTRKEDLYNPNISKLVCDQKGYALFFSRSPIPYLQGKMESLEAILPEKVFWANMGLYAYQQSFLEKVYPTLDFGVLEAYESLEQLRFLERGYRVKTLFCEKPNLAIDTPEDLVKARKYLKARGK